MAEDDSPRPADTAEALEQARREERSERDSFIADRIDTTQRLSEAMTTGRVSPTVGNG